MLWKIGDCFMILCTFESFYMVYLIHRLTTKTIDRIDGKRSFQFMYKMSYEKCSKL